MALWRMCGSCWTRRSPKSTDGVQHPSQERYQRLIFHLLEDLTVYEEDPLLAERGAVHLFAAIHRRLEVPDD